MEGDRVSSSQNERTCGGRGEGGVLENEQGRTRSEGCQNSGVLSKRTF